MQCTFLHLANFERTIFLAKLGDLFFQLRNFARVLVF